jgi:hypothetical protein
MRKSITSSKHISFKATCKTTWAAAQLEQAAKKINYSCKAYGTTFKFENMPTDLNFGGIFKVLLELYPIILTSNIPVEV